MIRNIRRAVARFASTALRACGGTRRTVTSGRTAFVIVLNFAISNGCFDRWRRDNEE